METEFEPPLTPSWFTPGRFACLLTILVVAMFPHVIFGDQTFVFRDFGAFGYPLAFYHREAFWRGEMPLWNPLNECGVPFVAQWNTMTLYPLSLFYLLFPLSWSLPVFNIAHLILGGMGMYYLVRNWLVDDFAAAVGGIIYAFNGLFLNSLTWPNNSAALGWMPWVVLAVELGWTRGGRWVVAAAVVGALQMLTGAPEVIALTWLFLAGLWVTSLAREPRKIAISQSLRLFGIGILVSGLAAAQLFPFFDLLLHSQRHAEYGKSDWAMPGWGLANFLAPLFFTSIVANGVRFQYTQYWTSSYYIPLAALALAVLSILYWRKRRCAALIAATILSLILAMGDNAGLYAVLRKMLPILGFMRYPIKFVVLTVFLLPILAAFTLKELLEMERSRWKELGAKLASCWVIFVLLTAFIVWFGRAYPQYQPPYSNWQLTAKNAAARIGFLTLALPAFLLLRRIERPALFRLMQISLLVVLWLDALTHMPDQNPTAIRAIFDPDLNYLKPAPRHGVSRAMLSRTAYIDLWRNTSVDTYTNYLCTRLGLNADVNLLDHVPKIDGFYSLDLKDPDTVRRFFYQTGGLKPAMLQDFLGVSHVTSPGTTFDWDYRTNFLPLITGGQAPLFLESQAAYKWITSTNFDPRGSVALPPEARPLITAGRVTDVNISPRQITAQLLKFDVRSPAPALVVIAQSFFHPWQATVNNQRVDIWKANYAFQAIPVPAGASSVRLVYVDWVFRGGLILSALAVMGSAGLWYHFRTKPI